MTAQSFTPGPWVVITKEIPYSLRDGHTGVHIERTIHTGWEHPQMRGAAPVVVISVGVGAEPGGAPSHLVYIKEEDARLISAAPDLFAALQTFVDKYDSFPGGWLGAGLTNGDFFAARAAIAKAKGEVA